MVDNEEEIAAEASEYSSHKEQILDSQPTPERTKELEESLLKAYEKVITYRETPFIVFGELDAVELANAFIKYPMIIKPTLCCVNVAQRAIKRDLGFDLDTYAVKITDSYAALLAGYIKPMLPPAIAVPALMELDRFFWTDKEMRARKGNWEKTVTDAINGVSEKPFRKRRFTCDGEDFEIDAACPAKGDKIDIAIDVKRIESQRDIHKRADEIINKATKFKKVFPVGKFLAIVYYPFPNQHINLQSRLHSDFIDEVFFAGETRSSIANTVDMLVGKLGLKKKVVSEEASLFDFDKEKNSRDKSLVSAKRTGAERVGIHAWHPYYAGYSVAFVESAIHHLRCSRETLILDPWGGSGTTGLVASREGVPSVCLDINPVMASFSAAKSHLVLSHEDEISRFFDALSPSVERGKQEGNDEPLTNIFHADTASLIRAVADAIPAPGHIGGTGDITEPTVVSSVRDLTQLIHPVYAFYLAVIFVTLREISGTQTSANPTWLRTAENKVFVEPDSFFRDLRRNAINMLADLRAFFGRRGSLIQSYSLSGDTKKLPIKDCSVDRIITSPPYLTRIDYAMSTMPEMFLFGNDDLLTFVRHQTMGAPVITKNGKHQKEEWGPLCNNILEAIRKHPTKAAESYYWKNIVQYFIDMDAALDELVRVLKPGGRGLIVVQSSYFKDIEMPLGEIYREMATMKGLSSEIAFREEVKGHMAHVNTRSNLYKKGKVYYEDFVFIERSNLAHHLSA